MSYGELVTSMASLLKDVSSGKSSLARYQDSTAEILAIVQKYDEEESGVLYEGEFISVMTGVFGY